MPKKATNAADDAERSERSEEPRPEETAAPKRGRQSAAPTCPYHKGTPCVARNSNSYFTRYYCPKEGCPFMIKQPRPNMRTRLSRQDEDFSAR